MNTDEWKLEFNKNGVEIFKRIKNPFDNQIKDSPLPIMDYDTLIEKIENGKINMVVTKIDRKIENDVLKSLIFYVSEFNFMESSDFQNQIIIDAIEDQNLLFFDDKTKPWTLSNDMLKITAQWLFDNGRLQSKDLPVYVPRGKRYLINTKPVHESGKSFESKYQISSDMYLLINFSTDGCKMYAEYLMKKFAPEINFKILGL